MLETEFYEQRHTILDAQPPVTLSVLSAGKKVNSKLLVIMTSRWAIRLCA